jgi:cell division protein YceG involved in septum cleavage
MIKKIILLFLLSILVFIALVGAWVAQLVYQPINITHTICEIKNGDTGRIIANRLYEHNVIRNSTLFHLLIRIKGIDREL